MTVPLDSGSSGTQSDDLVVVRRDSGGDDGSGDSGDSGDGRRKRARRGRPDGSAVDPAPIDPMFETTQPGIRVRRRPAEPGISGDPAAAAAAGDSRRAQTVVVSPPLPPTLSDESPGRMIDVGGGGGGGGGSGIRIAKRPSPPPGRP